MKIHISYLTTVFMKYIIYIKLQIDDLKWAPIHVNTYFIFNCNFYLGLF